MMKHSLKAPDHWFSQNLTAWCLLPVSLVFCLAALVRRWSYRYGFSSSRRSTRPVVVVGNIAVGGTGKSPLMIALCKLLKEQGLSVGIVTRGYGSNLIGPYTVTNDDHPAMVGDEALMLLARTKCPLIIAEERFDAVRLLQTAYDLDVILSDDGMQHYAMGRDMEIAVVDAGWMHGNGFCMPSGPLREPVSRLKSVDYVVYNKTVDTGDELKGFRLKINECRNLKTDAPRFIKEFRGQRVHAVAGIGTPARFFETLRNEGIIVIEHPYDDHHIFDGGELLFEDDLPVLITEKDAVKCRGYGLENIWTVIVDAVLDEELEQELLGSIRKLCDEQKAAVTTGLPEV